MAQISFDVEFLDIEIYATLPAMSETRDRIDQVLADWQRERPDLDWSGAAVTLRLVLLGKYVEQHAAASFAPFGLQPWEFDVIGTLRRQGEPYTLSAGDLARSVLLTCSGMTHRLDRLQERGLVERVAAPEDRRRVMVRLTAAGLALVDEAIARRSCEACDLVDGLAGSQRDDLIQLLRALVVRLGIAHEDAVCEGALGSDPESQP